MNKNTILSVAVSCLVLMAGYKNDVSSFIPKSHGLVFTVGYNDEQYMVSGDFTNG